MAKQGKLRRLKSADDLQPAPYNPREIDPAAKHGLTRSVEEFGDLSGIVWNSRTGHLVAGHQRVDVLKESGAVFLTDPPRFVHGDDEFPVRVVDWDADTERAANLTANNPGIQGHFTADVDAIVAEIESAMPDLYESLRLDEIAAQDGDAAGGAGLAQNDAGGPPEMELQPFEHYDYIVVLARNTMDWEWLCEKFGIEKRNVSPLVGRRKIGLGRAVDAKKVIAVINGE